MLQRLPPPVRAALALAFGAWVLLFTGLWMVEVYWAAAPVELGFDGTYRASDRSVVIHAVVPQSPAEDAGLRPGDRIVAIDGVRLESADTQPGAWRRHKPGDTVRLTVARPGHAAPLALVGTFRSTRPGNTTEYVASRLRNLYPIPFVVVGLAVLLLRSDDPNAWRLALLFASFVAVPGFPDFIGVAPALRPFARASEAIFIGLLGPLFYWFFAVFPVRSSLDVRAPWLKVAGVAGGLALAAPGIPYGELRVPWLAGVSKTLNDRVAVVFVFAFLVLGLVSLAWNASHSRSSEARRRIRVMVWGAGIGIVPGLVARALENFGGLRLPDWLTTAHVLLSTLFPLSFAYAVVRHRVLEIPVLIRRSARYLLVQRGFTFLLTLASMGATLAFALTVGPRLQVALALGGPTGITIGAVFGTLLLWGGLAVHRRVSTRIDRAFFRAAYDARIILEDLAAKLGAASGRGEVTSLLARHLQEALQPTRLVVYLEDAAGTLRTDDTGVPSSQRSLGPADPVLAGIGAAGHPIDVAPRKDGPGPGDTLRPGDLGAECLVPMVARGGRLAGLIVLWPRRSEEPYSGEDLRLLASVAAQAAGALDNIRLAEDIAARLEAEHRSLREMEIAREVQRKLLPQSAPSLRTLACAAQCIQARLVGGDYYDFLEFGRGLTGLVLADVSGKGVHAALLMANLQAHLRSQSSATPGDPARALREVNRLLYASTAAQHYATLFFAVYDDTRRVLRYVNCGHNPPVLLRAGREVERLSPTAPAIGLFDQWDCSVGETALAPGDLLAVFSDGVTESPANDVEFGEERFIGELGAVRDREPAAIVDAILASVLRYSGDTQYDDLTLLVARARA